MARFGREFRSARLNPSTVLCLRHFGPYEAVNDTWTRLTTIAFDRGLSGPTTQAMGVVYDDPTTTPPERIRYDACLSVEEARIRDVPLADPLQEFTGIRLENLTFGESLMTVHYGAYTRITEAYTDMMQRVTLAPDATTRRVRQRPPYVEVYKNNPILTPASELVTEIYFPLESEPARA